VGELVHAWTGGLTEPRLVFGHGLLGASNLFPWPEIGTGTATLTGSGTVLEIVTSTDANTFTYAVDGGTAVTVTPSSLGPPGMGAALVTVTGLADTAHTVVLTSPGPSRYIYAAGLRPATGVVLENAGLSGSTVDDWARMDNGVYSAAETLFAPTHIDHDAVVIELGMNDRWQGVPVATFTAALSALVDRAQARGASVFLVASNSPQGWATAPTWADFVAAIYAVADTQDVPLLDLTDRWGMFESYNADGSPRDLATDSVHLTAAGNAAKMRALVDLLSV
jgi:lysophospholipase L1-like esterase